MATFNRHHLIGQCNKNYANVDDIRNIVKMEIVRHNGLNSLFQCLQSPYEQLNYLRNLYNSVLSETSKNLFDSLLNQNIKDFYAEGLIKNNKHKNIKRKQR